MVVLLNVAEAVVMGVGDRLISSEACQQLHVAMSGDACLALNTCGRLAGERDVGDDRGTT